jgi:hypothetical protein
MWITERGDENAACYAVPHTSKDKNVDALDLGFAAQSVAIVLLYRLHRTEGGCLEREDG